MKSTLLAIILVCINTLLVSQEIDANVTIDDQALEQGMRINISSLAQDLEKYIDNTRFMDDDWEGEQIPVDLAIVLMGGNRNIYSARLLINSQRYVYNGDGEKSIVLKLIDNQWQFEYQRGAFHSYNHLRFNSFISLIDYYMLLVIGSDLDTYGDEASDDAYERARQICLLGASANSTGYETYNEPGEFTRYSHISQILDPRYNEWRELVATYYLDGIDYIKEDIVTAKSNLSIIISKMADFKANKLSGPSVVLQAFFQSNAKQIAQFFNGYENQQVFEDLYYLDPSNSMQYRKAQDGKY
ncbi:DUF4835 family protein [Candidatus Kapabacteria bacterium]|nr:DUF4835 family protein [Candidatus Kapabacteria bacterium]